MEVQYVYLFVFFILKKFYNILKDVLYNALIDPLTRELFEYVQQIQPNEKLFQYLYDRSNVRQITGTGLKPAYIEPADPIVRDVNIR